MELNKQETYDEGKVFHITFTSELHNCSNLTSIDIASLFGQHAQSL